ncbi:GNAT family N-acetyltransferase [Actinoplanes couchii]|uniref:GNAT family N-acetyltransferase n=1 Tax=Actinoplanes couchii TaxID=403638 RepID=A0ABQ3XCY0_9ACTN|nr:GNAT family N-acetyltransferase [Actinoplanes couchii]MDR6321206.1 putative GNAT superfamily acetyltransferase [Actinoplanes couchii]GID56315.1 hypothetical protein Aco03nite_047190 [Actinoplanes couchii]
MEHSKETNAARESAERAAAGAGVTVRAMNTTADSFACERFLAEVWKPPPGSPALAADVIMAMADAGSYVAGAFDGELLLAVCIGFWGPPGRAEMHSHVAGVLPGARRRDVGFALKLDQRAHVLENGGHEITWTFDPLVARNAHFNIRKLGGTAEKYLVDHYGPLSDGINGSDETDRLLLRWDLLASPARPVPPEGTILVAVPSDIESLRQQDPRSARDWRLAVREKLAGPLAGGARIVDFDRVAGGYVLDQGDC